VSLQHPVAAADIPEMDLPPARLGALLRAARRRAGLTRGRVAARAGVTRSVVREVERGRSPAGAGDLAAALAAACGTDLGQLVPARDAPAAGAGVVSIAGHALALDGVRPDALLGDFVALVARLRSRPVRDVATLRTGDLATIATALGTTTGDVEHRLVRLLGCTPGEARSLHREMLRRGVLVPAAGMVLGAAAVGALALAVDHGGAAPAPVEADAPATERVVPAGDGTPAPAPPRSTATTAPATSAPPTTAAPATQAAPPTTAAPLPPPPATAPPPTGAEPAPDVALPPGETITEVPPPAAPDVSVPPGETFTEIAP
jgi:transcriptional regulator with XRE-family HTH domain